MLSLSTKELHIKCHLLTAVAMAGGALKHLLNEASRKVEECSWKILSDVSKGALWSKQAQIGLKIWVVKISTEGENCVNYDKV